ncbi:MAG: hypothetical protein Fur0016_20450 [Anaerolineales bacterium]
MRSSWELTVTTECVGNIPLPIARMYSAWGGSELTEVVWACVKWEYDWNEERVRIDSTSASGNRWKPANARNSPPSPQRAQRCPFNLGVLCGKNLKYR